MHVTLRVLPDVPSLRNNTFMKAFRQTLADCCIRDGFKVIHYSIQSNHVHCLMEARDKSALGNGMKSFVARFARAVNRVFERKGKVLDGRYHMRILNTPREVRNALAYVLLNVRKHFVQCYGRRPPQARIDPCSSGHFFDGWKDVKPDITKDPPHTCRPFSWLLVKGWRRRGLISVAEVPGGLA